MPKIVIFDLDGTLAIIDDRMRLATGGKTTEGNYKKINWDKYFANALCFSFP